MYRLMLVIAMVAVAQGKDLQRIGIGYDNGISVRWKMGAEGKWQSGLVVGGSPYNYSENQDELTHDDSLLYFMESTHKSKGFDIDLHFARQLWFEMFTLSPYARAGYGLRLSEYSSRDTRDQGGGVSRDWSQTRESTDHFIRGEIGVMPGFNYKRFSVEFRLGIQGHYGISNSPDKQVSSDGYSSDRSFEGVNRRISFVYPGDVLRSLVIHFWL